MSVANRRRASMLSSLQAVLLGGVTLLTLVLNTVLWGVPVYAVILARVLVPVARWRRGCGRLLVRMAECWIGCNNAAARLLLKTDWDVQGIDDLDPRGSYLVSCNHQSWLDVPVLQRVFNRRVPFLRFFIKQELIWVPILGLAWWAMDMPFVKRYPRTVLEKHPELRGKDIETTRKACARLRDQPVAILSFVEGTRFTPRKHAAQPSPYRHLLRPKAGGKAFVLATMGERMRTLLDVTIVYPDGGVTFWKYLSGRVSRIIVRVQQRAIPGEFLQPGYESVAEMRDRFQGWVQQLWSEKDACIERLLQEAAQPAAATRT